MRGGTQKSITLFYGAVKVRARQKVPMQVDCAGGVYISVIFCCFVRDPHIQFRKEKWMERERTHKNLSSEPFVQCASMASQSSTCIVEGGGEVWDRTRRKAADR